MLRAHPPSPSSWPTPRPTLQSSALPYIDCRQTHLHREKAAARTVVIATPSGRQARKLARTQSHVFCSDHRVRRHGAALLLYPRGAVVEFFLAPVQDFVHRLNRPQLGVQAVRRTSKHPTLKVGKHGSKCPSSEAPTVTVGVTAPGTVVFRQHFPSLPSPSHPSPLVCPATPG